MNAKAEVTKLAKKLYGKNAIIEERKYALNAEGRQAEMIRSQARRNRMQEIEPICKEEFLVRQRVLKAAQFVCDVDAGEPSLSELKTVMAEYRKIETAIEERRELIAEGRKVSTHSRKCNVSEYMQNAPLPMSMQICAADTWEECLVELKRVAKVHAA